MKKDVAFLNKEILALIHINPTISTTAAVAVNFLALHIHYLKFSNQSLHI